MSKLMLFIVLGVFATAFAILAWGQQPPPPLATRNPHELAALMRAKLASSQKVVEGLVAKDFDLIHKAGEEMIKVCDATDWNASDDQVYAHYRSELRRTAKKLILLAEEKNLDGSAYTYMHSLTTCIACHEYCRDVLHVAKNSPDLVIPIPTSEPIHAERKKSLRR